MALTLNPDPHARYAVGTPAQASFTILPVVTASASGNPSRFGPVVGSLTITRTGDLSTSLTIAFSLGGSARFGNDYALSGQWAVQPGGGTITFTAGVSSVSLTLTPTPSSQSGQSIGMTILDGAGYVAGTPGSAGLTIDGTPPPPWLVLLYLAGDDVAPNAGQTSLTDYLGPLLRRLPYNPNMRLVVLYDGNAVGDAAIYLREQSDLRNITDQVRGSPLWLGGFPTDNELDTGSSTTLQNFIRWARATYPGSPHTMLSVVDHGGGWAPAPDTVGQGRTPGMVQSGGVRGLSIDRLSGNSLSTRDTETVLSDLGELGRFDVIFYDACPMLHINSVRRLPNARNDHDCSAWYRAGERIRVQICNRTTMAHDPVWCAPWASQRRAIQFCTIVAEARDPDEELLSIRRNPECPPVAPEALGDAVGDQCEKQRIHPAGVGQIQRLVVAEALLDRQHDGREPGPQQLQVHEQPGRATVPVDERVDLHEVGVQTRGTLDGVEIPRRLVPGQKIGHCRWDTDSVRGAVFRACDKDVDHTVVPGVFVVDILEDKLVDIPQMPCAQRLGGGNQRLHVHDSVAVVDRLEVFAQELSTDGDTLKDDPRLLEGQRVPLNGVGVVRPAHDKVIVQVAHEGGRQRAHSIQASLLLIKLVKHHPSYRHVFRFRQILYHCAPRAAGGTNRELRYTITSAELEYIPATARASHCLSGGEYVVQICNRTTMAHDPGDTLAWAVLAVHERPVRRSCRSRTACEHPRTGRMCNIGAAMFHIARNST